MHISSKCSSGHVECNFDNTAKNFPPNFQNIFAENPEIIIKLCFFHKLSFLKLFLSIIANVPQNTSEMERFLIYVRN